MTGNSAIALYDKHYSNPQFERLGLFEALANEFYCSDVLYPGSFIHITPSYCFPHVVYVDQSPIVKDFFDESGAVLTYINRKKQYKRSAYIRFIQQDYLANLPLREGSFDLLLSLFTGSVTTACKKYLKIGGILVTNNFHNDARAAAEDPEFELASALHYRSKKYVFVAGTPQALLSKKATIGASKYIRQNSTGVEYIEKETYFIYKRCRSKG